MSSYYSTTRLHDMGFGDAGDGPVCTMTPAGVHRLADAVRGDESRARMIRLIEDCEIEPEDARDLWIESHTDRPCHVMRCAVCAMVEELRGLPSEVEQHRSLMEARLGGDFDEMAFSAACSIVEQEREEEDPADEAVTE